MADVDVTIQELKHEVKVKKSLDKKEKKRQKRDMKHAKKVKAKQAKKEKQVKKLSEKAGIHSPEVKTSSSSSADGMGVDWTRRSDVPIETVELKLDSMFEPRGEEIQKRWKDKYGDEADIPSDMLRPKVDMKDLERDSTVVSDKPAKAKLGMKKPGKFSFGTSKPSSESVGELSLLDLRKPPEGLWLYQKFGQDKPKIVSLVIMVISLVLYIFPMLIIRIIFFVLFKILDIVKAILKKVLKKEDKATKS